MKTSYMIGIAIVAIAIIAGSIVAYTYMAAPADEPSPSATTSPSATPTATPPASTISLSGQGASFPYPLLSTMITEYTESVAPNTMINYQPVGSGGGISALIAKTSDFAGSDAPLKASEAEQAPNALHIPETIGAVTVAYNLPDIPAGVHLTGEIVADIFAGTITMWNDPAIQDINAGTTLPEHEILVVHRADSSGTTFIFTGYLTAMSTSWADDLGQGKTVAWPVGVGAKGNSGVAAVIIGQPYAIGYVELAYALENDMTVAAIQNPSGNWVVPSLDSTSQAAAAAASAGLPAGADSWSNVDILNAPGNDAYPIVSFSYLIVYQELNVVEGMTQEKAETLVDFLWYVVHDGQDFAAGLEYAPIPDNVVQLNEATLQSITFNGHTVYTS
ncbi:MAG: phosphate ABC transporter substrate-binding protein PstS [Candidatus Bathyarchaeota archaeon]|nr:phosphate ABC transporter substrate-binding protein PstS [Candidatus Bathyarchaeota archaeon]